jgi:hypothetical protein
MNTPAALLALSLGLIALAAQADEPAPRGGLETLRFAPSDYSPYRAPGVERSAYRGVDWTGLAQPAPEPRVAVPAVIRGPAVADPRRR